MYATRCLSLSTRWLKILHSIRKPKRRWHPMLKLSVQSATSRKRSLKKVLFIPGSYACWPLVPSFRYWSTRCGFIVDEISRNQGSEEEWWVWFIKTANISRDFGNRSKKVKIAGITKLDDANWAGTKNSSKCMSWNRALFSLLKSFYRIVFCIYKSCMWDLLYGMICKLDNF